MLDAPSEEAQAYGDARAAAERERWERVAAAGDAVVKRWDSPMWKHQEHTSVLIHGLRDSIAAIRATTQEDQP